jgi:hypothetical protein
MTYQEFLNRIQKRGSKPHKIKHCLGVRDAWKWHRHKKWEYFNNTPCDQSLYSKVINEVNKVLADKLLEGNIVELPYQLGCLYLAGRKPKVYMSKGKVITNYLVDWKKTLEFWYNDKEARDKHQKIKRIQNNIYYLKYDKKKAVYRNKRFYLFRLNRSFAKKVGKAVEEGILNNITID